MILLFSLFMFIFGLIIHLISSAVKIVPLGEKLDKAIGFISGVVKGLIVAIIVYFILYTVNMIPNVHIPPDNTVLNNVMQMIGAVALYATVSFYYKKLENKEQTKWSGKNF